MTASTRPQAMLQPITPMSKVRSSSRPAVAALSVPVNVNAMISPKSTSETRAIGSRTRSCRRLSSGIDAQSDRRRLFGHDLFPSLEHLSCVGPREDVHDASDNARPSGLMAGTKTGAVVTVEILVEQNQIAPVRIVVELARPAVDRSLPVLILEEDRSEAPAEILRDLIQVHSPSRSSGTLDR